MSREIPEQPEGVGESFLEKWESKQGPFSVEEKAELIQGLRKVRKAPFSKLNLGSRPLTKVEEFRWKYRDEEALEQLSKSLNWGLSAEELESIIYGTDAE